MTTDSHRLPTPGAPDEAAMRTASGVTTLDGHLPSRLRALTGTPLRPEAMAAYFAERLEGRLRDVEIAFGQLTLTVETAALPMVARLCKSDPRLDFSFFDFLSGVDERDDGFAVVTHLYSVRHGHHVQLRVMADGGREDPRVPTISDVYRGANWHERETYDMFGITFDGHPGLLPRILTVENFEGWPLRKDFLLSTREVKPWPGLKEPKDPDADDAEAGPGAVADDAKAKPKGMSAEEKAAAAKAKAERAKRKAAEMRAKKARERAEAMGEETGDGEPAVEKGARAGAPTADGVAPEDSTPRDFADNMGTDTESNEAARGSGGERPGAPYEPDATPGAEVEGRHTGAVEQSGDTPAAETPGMTSPTQEAEGGQPPSTTPAPGPESDRADPADPGTDELPDAEDRRRPTGDEAEQADEADEEGRER